MRKGLLVAFLLSILASGAFARQVEDDGPPPDARTEGYALAGRAVPNAGGAMTPLLITPASGTAGTWFMTAFLGAICIGVMFKSGKRSHLD